MAKLKINRGTTYIRTGTVRVDGELVNLNGATVAFTVKNVEYDSSVDDSSALIVKNITNGTTDGKYEITILPTDTINLAPSKYYYDIKVKLTGGEVFKIDEGTITLDGSPTNRLT